MKQSEKREPRLKVFSERFELLRKERNLSNTDFAKFLGMSRQTVGFYLNGERVPDAITLIKIAEKCNVSADWLLGLSAVKSRDIEEQKVCTYTGLSQEAIHVLHDSASEQGNPVTFLFNKLLNERRMARYAMYACRGAIVELYSKKLRVQEINQKGQLSWDEYFKTDEYKASLVLLDNSKKTAYRKFISEVNKPAGEKSEVLIEIDRREAKKLYKNMATEIMKTAIDHAYRDFIEEIARLGLGDEYKKV